NVRMARLDIAPRAFVRCIADAEIVEGKALRAGFRDVLVEQEVAGTEGGKVVFGEGVELADDAVRQAARSGDGAHFPAHLQGVQDERGYGFAKGGAEQAAQPGLHVRRREGIGGAHTREALALEAEEQVEESVGFLDGARHKTAIAAGGLQLAELGAMLLSPSLAAASFE